MKKTLLFSRLIWITSIILAFVFSIQASAIGINLPGSFSIRGGATFGMTMDDIQGIENKNGTSEIEIDLDRNRLCLKEDYIAGVDVGRCNMNNVQYYFNDYGEFDELYYWFGYFDSATQYNSNFESVVAQLSDKYGSPLFFNDGNVFVLDGRAWNDYKHNLGCEDYAQWLIKYDVYYVICDVVGEYWSDSNTYQIHMNYKLLTSDYVDSIVGERNEEEKNRNSSKDKDI